MISSQIEDIQKRLNFIEEEMDKLTDIIKKISDHVIAIEEYLDHKQSC